MVVPAARSVIPPGRPGITEVWECDPEDPACAAAPGVQRRLLVELATHFPELVQLLLEQLLFLGLLRDRDLLDDILLGLEELETFGGDALPVLRGFAAEDGKRRGNLGVVQRGVGLGDLQVSFLALDFLVLPVEVLGQLVITFGELPLPHFDLGQNRGGRLLAVGFCRC